MSSPFSIGFGSGWVLQVLLVDHDNIVLQGHNLISVFVKNPFHGAERTAYNIVLISILELILDDDVLISG
jgi:hypothetical protein